MLTAGFSLSKKLLEEKIYIYLSTPEIMHEFIEKIVVHAPDKSSGHSKQKIGIYFRFNVATATVIADSWEYDKKKKGCVGLLHNL